MTREEIRSNTLIHGEGVVLWRIIYDDCPSHVCADYRTVFV